MHLDLLYRERAGDNSNASSVVSKRQEVMVAAAWRTSGARTLCVVELNIIERLMTRRCECSTAGGKRLWEVFVRERDL